MPRQNFLAFIVNHQGLVASISLVRQFCMTDGHNRLLNPTLHKWACGKFIYSALHPQQSNSHTIPSHSHTHYSPTYTLSPTHPHSPRSTCRSCRCGRPCHRRCSQCLGWNPSSARTHQGHSWATAGAWSAYPVEYHWREVREREREWELMLTGLLSAETSSMRSIYIYRPLSYTQFRTHS